MRWMVAWVSLHVVGITLNIPFDDIITTKMYKWFYASTTGCSMVVDWNHVYFDNMDRLCTVQRKDLAKIYGLKDRKATFSCTGSKRCCTRCKTQFSPNMNQAIFHVAVITRDEFRVIFQRGLVIMAVTMVVELLLSLILVCSAYRKELIMHELLMGPRTDVDLDTTVRKDGRISTCQWVFFVFTVVSLVMLSTEICLLIALVLMPAVSHMTDMSCSIYVLIYAISVLITYSSVGVMISRYIAIINHVDVKQICKDVSVCETVLSVMWLIMCLATVCSVITVAINNVIMAYKS